MKNRTEDIAKNAGKRAKKLGLEKVVPPRFKKSKSAWLLGFEEFSSQTDSLKKLSEIKKEKDKAWSKARSAQQSASTKKGTAGKNKVKNHTV